MLEQARIESGLNPAAKAKTSSAAGLFQFTSATWLDLVKRHGEKVGLDEASRSLRSGNISADQRADLLAKRHDPTLSSELAARFAIENAQMLQKSGHGNIGSAELYLAHFLGPQGANTFLNGLKTEPGSAAANALPQAAKSNTQIFYTGGKTRSYAEIFAQFQKKFGVASASAISADSASIIAKAAVAEDALKSNQFAILQDQGKDNMTSPALGKSAKALFETGVQNPSSDASIEPQTPGSFGDLNLDEAALGSFLRGFELHQGDPGLTPIINESEVRDVSVGANSDTNGAPNFGFGRQLAGHALGGKLIVKTLDMGARNETVIEDVRRPTNAKSAKPSFSDLAALWGGGSKG